MIKVKEDEIIRAHDILDALIHDELPVTCKTDFIKMAEVAHQVLCWILGHDDLFMENIVYLESKLSEIGITFFDSRTEKE
jgi:hypothetical protein